MYVYRLWLIGEAHSVWYSFEFECNCAISCNFKLDEYTTYKTRHINESTNPNNYTSSPLHKNTRRPVAMYANSSRLDNFLVLGSFSFQHRAPHIVRDIQQQQQPHITKKIPQTPTPRAEQRAAVLAEEWRTRMKPQPPPPIGWLFVRRWRCLCTSMSHAGAHN